MLSGTCPQAPSRRRIAVEKWFHLYYVLKPTRCRDGPVSAGRSPCGPRFPCGKPALNALETASSIDWPKNHGKQNGPYGAMRRLAYLACRILPPVLVLVFVLTTDMVKADSSPAFATNVQKKQAPQLQTQPHAQTARGALSSLEKTVISFTNGERKKHGLAPFRASVALSQVARKHSVNMCRSGVMLHESDKFPLGWKTFQERLRHIPIQSGAENIGYRTWTRDEGKWAQEVVKGWISSPQHRKNILHPDYTFLGVGIYLCESGIAFATQIFSSEGTGHP